MSKAYSEDLRIRVIRYVEGGASTYAAARRFEIGVATVGRWFRQWRHSGMASAGPRGHPGGSKLDAHADFLLDLFKKTPDLTLEDVRRRLFEEHGVTAGIGTVWRFYDRRGITFKKKPVRV